jgi:hypothetical protein
MAVRLSRPAHLIDIKAVGGLDVLAVRDETVRRLFASAVAMLSAFGWWNLGFIIGTVLLVPLGLALESIGPHGPDAGGGAMALWYLGAALFLLFNVAAVIKGLVKGEPVLKAVIGCVLPFVVAWAFMELMEIWPI